MAVDLTKSGISAVVGVVDTVAEQYDRKNGKTEAFRKSTDILRLVVAAVGYGAQVFMPKYEKIGEALALSSTPLLVKSVMEAANIQVFKEEAAMSFTPRRISNGVRDWVVPGNQPAQGGYRFTR